MTTLSLKLRDILIQEVLELLDPLPYAINLEELLAAHRLIAAGIWSVEDVREVRPDLTEDQAWEVLQECDRQKDSTQGMTWDTLRCVAEELFGLPPKRG